MRWRRIALVGGALVLVVLVVATGAVFVFTNTDWGRERTRRFAIGLLGRNVHGIVRVDGLGGNLLTGATLRGVSITDSSGAPFLRADEVRARYTLGSFVSKRIDLDNVTLVRPVIVLDRPPGGRWNYERIFPKDTTKKGSQPPGFGSWVRLTDVTVIDGHLTTRASWAPNSRLSARQRDSVIAFDLGPKGRQNIVRVAGGFQRVSEFRAIYGTFPLLRLQDPNEQAMIIDVASLRTIALPFRPPAVEVRAVRGRFIVDGDSLYFRGVDAGLAGSRLAGDGRYNIDNNDLRLRLHGDPVATNDLLWIDPSIPRNGTGALDFALDWVGDTSDYVARNARLQVAGATIAGKLGVRMIDTAMVFHDTDLRATRLDTRTIAQLFPTLQSPWQGYLTGRAAVAGPLDRMQLDADVAFDEPLSGRSRVAARGVMGVGRGNFLASNLRVSMRPVRVALARRFAPTFPIGGTVTGNAVLNGSTAERMTARGDVTHTDVTGQSRVVGDVAFAPGGARVRTPTVNADVRLLPLSLATVGRFAPAAGLQGSVTGPVRLTGPMSNLRLAADLTTPDGGSLTASGTANLASRDKAYDLAIATRLFDARAVSTKAPRTSVTADATVRGTGISPETIDAVLAANVRASSYDTVGVDSVKIRVAAAHGVLRVDTLVVDVPHARANASGMFGLTAAHSGELRYALVVDSLGAFSRFLLADTGVVVPRPGIVAERLRRAREDSARVARVTEVQRAVTGAPMPKVVVDTPAVLRRETLAGTVRAEGTLRGNIKTFDAEGTASATNVVALGNSANTLAARYTWQHARTPQSRVTADVRAGGLLAGGFQFDSVTVQASYQKPNGTLMVAVRQSDNRQYGANAAFVLHRERNEVLLNDLRLRFDSTVYRSTRPSRIAFGTAGIDVDSLDVRGNYYDSRFFLDGRIPRAGAADLHLSVRNFDVGNVLTLLQSDVPARGLVSFEGDVGGTAADPRVRGAFGASHVWYAGREIPEVHGTADYAAQTLTADVSANLPGGPPVLRARGTVPVNLAMSGVTGSRIPAGRAIALRVDADSLPLDRLPEVSTTVSNMRGRATAHVTVGGTVDKPVVAGQMLVQNGSMFVVPAGITLHDMWASVRLLRDSIAVDSLVARSHGPVRVSGGIGIANLKNPTIGGRLVARNMQVLDNDQGSVRANADITVGGRLDALGVRGSATLLSGVIYIPESDGKTLIGTNDPALFSVLDTAVLSNRDLFPTQSPILTNLRANVAVTVNRDVFVRSRAANVEIYSDGPLIVSANNRRRSLTVDGVLVSDRGEYRFQSRRFLIRRGSATFINSPELNPTLQVTGEYEVQLPAREPIVIRILINGTLRNPRIALESDAQPPISQSDLLSYLAFGRSSTSLLQLEGSGLTTGGTGSGNVVGRAAALAQQQVAGAAVGSVTEQFAGEAARSLGADVLTITPADVSPDVGNFLRATQVEFGKYLSTRTFLGLQFRPDPASLKRPGFQLQHTLDRKRQYGFLTSLEPRYLLREPSLASDIEPQTTSVFGLFLFREWRY